MFARFLRESMANGQSGGEYTEDERYLRSLVQALQRSHNMSVEKLNFTKCRAYLHPRLDTEYHSPPRRASRGPPTTGSTLIDMRIQVSEIWHARWNELKAAARRHGKGSQSREGA